jgi:glycosyltransferase involved in cell wall biosynthesis
MIIPTFNEELSIGNVIENFSKQPNVKSIIVIDNNSSDKTVEIAKKFGAIVITKNENKGYSHSLVLGLKEALKTNSNIIGATEADGTYNSYDIQKMIPYLDNCDMVIGTRQNQIMSEKGNQNSIFHVWGNFLLAKLIQIKYFNLHHMGIVNLTDVGCVYRLMKRNALEKIIDDLTYPNSDKAVGGIGIGLYFTMLGIEKDLKILEIPVTFNKRIGISKIQSNKLSKAIKVGFSFFWLILTS